MGGNYEFKILKFALWTLIGAWIVCISGSICLVFNNSSTSWIVFLLPFTYFHNFSEYKIVSFVIWLPYKRWILCFKHFVLNAREVFDLPFIEDFFCSILQLWVLVITAAGISFWVLGRASVGVWFGDKLSLSLSLSLSLFCFCYSFFQSNLYKDSFCLY